MVRQIVTAEDVKRWRAARRASSSTAKIRGAERSEAIPDLAIDGYFDRLLKFIPAEVVGLYLAAQGIVRSVEDGGGTTALWITFTLCMILTPLYLLKGGVRKPGQLVVSTVAFAVWVFAIGGPFADMPIYEPWIASLLLLFYTAGAALLEPQGPAK